MSRVIVMGGMRLMTLNASKDVVDLRKNLSISNQPTEDKSDKRSAVANLDGNSRTEKTNRNTTADAIHLRYRFPHKYSITRRKFVS